MATSDKWRLLITKNAGYTGMVAVGEWQLRTQPGVARPFARDSMSAELFSAPGATLLGAAALTQHVSTYTYDNFVALTLPFNVNIGGLVTDKVVVNSYGMVSFGHDGSEHGWAYWLDSGNTIPYPFIAHGSAKGDSASAFQKLYAGAENGGSTYRIRLEMFAGWSNPGDGSVNTVWEVTFDSAFPDRVSVNFGTSGYAAVPGTSPGGGVIAVVGDGKTAPHVATFANVVDTAYTVITAPLVGDGTVTASAEDAYNPAVGTIDSDPRSRWVVNTTPSAAAPVWLQFTFSSAQTIKEYMIAAPDSYYDTPMNAMPGDWTLEYWDGSAWQIHDTQVNQSGWTYTEERTFTVVVVSNDGDVLLPLITLDAVIAEPDTIIGGSMAVGPLSVSGTATRSNDGQIVLGNSNNLGPVYNVTPFTLSGTATPGVVLNGEATIELLGLEGSLEGPLPLRGLSLTATGYTGTVASGNVRLSELSVAAAYADPITLAELTVDAHGFTGQVGHGNSAMLPLDAGGTGISGTVGRGALRLDFLEVHASTGTAGDIALAQLDVAATALTGQAGHASILLNRLSLDATGMADQLPTTGEATMLPLQMAGAMVAGQVGHGSAVMLAPTLRAAGQGDAVLSGALTLDAVQLNAAGLTGPVANGALTLPRWQLDASGSVSVPDNDGAGAAQLATLQSAGVLLSGRTADGAVTLSAPTLLATLVGDRIADGALTVRAPSVSATGINNPAGVAPGEAAGALSLWDLTIAAAGTTGTLASGAVQLPRLLADASLLGERIGAAATVLPDLLLDARMAESAAAPAHGSARWSLFELAATMHGGTMADASLPLPRLQLAGTMPPELVGDAAAVLPVLRLAGALIESAAAPAEGRTALPAFQLAATLGTGNMADGAALLRVPVMAAEAHASTEASADLRLPQPSLAARATADILIHGAVVLQQLDADASQAATIAGAATLRNLELAASGSTAAVIHGDVQLVPVEASAAAIPGNIAMASITVPLLRVDADGHADAVGTATIALPVLELDGVAVAAVPSPVFTGVAVNTRTQAVSTYQDLDFNSLTSFNGMVLAATADGIVALSGDTDRGAPIAANMASGVTSMESDQFKRVLCGYAGYSATGNLELTLITDTHHEYVYSLVPEQVGQLHAARVKFGRGVDGRYWQWKLANKAGAHFALDKLTLEVSALSRRT